MVIPAVETCTASSVARKLQLSYEQVAPRKGKIAVLTGESGLGKTYAVQRFLELPHRPITLKAQCRPDTEKSLYPLYEALADYLREDKWQNERIRRLFKEYLVKLPRLGPFIEPLLREPGYLRGIEATVAPDLLEASPYPHCLALLERLARNRSYIFWIDDLQWADRETLNLLSYLVTRLHGHSCFWILCVNRKRPGISHPEAVDNLLYYLRAATDSVTSVVRFDLRPYSRSELPELIERILGQTFLAASRELDALYERTRGVPYIVHTFFEILRPQLREKNGGLALTSSVQDLSLPTSLKQGIRRRLERLYSSLPQARRILELASVVGERFTEAPIDNLLNLCDSYNWLTRIEDESFLLRRLLEQRLWEFEHVTIRDYIYSTLGSNSGELHLRFAQYLEAGTVHDWSQIAYHYKAAGAEGPYLCALLSRAREELRQGFFHEAKEAFDELCRTPSVRLAGRIPASLYDVSYERAVAHFHIGDYEGCMSCLEDLALYTRTPVEKAQVALLNAKCLTKSNFRNDFVQAARTLESALEGMATCDDLELRGKIYSELTVTFSHLNNFGKARECFAKAERYLQESGSAVELARLMRKACVFYEPELALPILIHALEVLEKNHVNHEVIMVLVNISSMCLTENPKRATEALDQALEESARIGDYGLDYIFNNRALLRVYAGDLDGALTGFEEASKVSSREVCKLITRNNMGACFVLGGRVSRGVRVLRRTLAEALNVGEDVYVTSVRHNLALGCFLLGLRKEGLLLLAQAKVDCLDELNARYREKRFEAVAAMADELGATCRIDGEKGVPRRLEVRPPIFQFIEMEFWGD